MSAKSLFEERLAATIEATDDHVVVDMADVTFIDSSGISVLLVARQHLNAAGRMLLISGPSIPVARVFELTGLGALFDTQG